MPVHNEAGRTRVDSAAIDRLGRSKPASLPVTVAYSLAVLAVTSYFLLFSSTLTLRTAQHSLAIFDVVVDAASSISWTPCGSMSSYQLECGRLSVPLDYAHPSSGNASLFILRLLADPSKRKGSLFTNPGGPGVTSWNARHLEIMEVTEGKYDIVSWDLRGINATTPSVRCFESQEAADEFWAGSLWYEGIETNSSLRSSYDLNNFYSRVEFEDVKLREFWERCRSLSGDILSYVGTAASARDVVSMANAIDGRDSEINFWGFSYGSVLGQYLLALFPERAGRILLDGVVYGPNWGMIPAVEMYNALLTSDSVASYHGFARLCAEAGPGGCALASPNSTANSILEDIDDLVHDLYDPTHSILPSNLSRSSEVKVELFLDLMRPSRWQRVAQYIQSQRELVQAWKSGKLAGFNIHLLAKSSETEEVKYGRHELKQFWDFEFYANYWSILCSDGPDHDGTITRDVFDAVIEARDKDDLFAIWPTEGAWPCHHWAARAVERVTNFTVKPKHPVLLLSNLHDPITSIQNSVEVLKNILSPEDAGLGIRNNYGHCSYTMKSPCLDKIIQAYIHDWTLPQRDMKPCPTEDDVFPIVPRGG